MTRKGSGVRIPHGPPGRPADLRRRRRRAFVVSQGFGTSPTAGASARASGSRVVRARRRRRRSGCPGAGRRGRVRNRRPSATMSARTTKGAPSMATPRTLVFGDDGSSPADTAWLWINNHRWPGWRVVALTAVMPEIGPPVPPELAAPHPWDPPEPRVALPSSGIATVEHARRVMDPRLALSTLDPAPDLLVV